MPRKKSQEKLKLLLTCNDENFISNLLDVLQSESIIEQLGLESVIGLKTQPTFRHLKQRMFDYVANNMSMNRWAPDNTFREHVVESGVMALTLDQIADVIAHRKMEEIVIALALELKWEHEKKLGMSKIQNEKKNSILEQLRKSGLAETAKIVKAICEDTKQNMKKIYQDGLVAFSLASAAKSESGDSDSVCSINDDNLSDGEDSEVRIQSVKIKTEPGRKKTKFVKPSLPLNRSQRARKLNPKYSSGLYHTSLKSPLQQPPSMPVTFKAEIVDDGYVNGNVSPVTKKPKIFAKSSKKNRENGYETDKEDNEEHSSPPKKKVKQFPKLQSPHKEEYINGSVRKSNRQPKVNSRIFCDSLPPYDTKGLRAVFTTNEAEDAKPNVSVLTDEKFTLFSPKVVDAAAPIVQVPSSTKRYNSSDLYKPHNMLSASRTKKIPLTVP